MSQPALQSGSPDGTLATRLRRGDHLIWLTGAALALCLLMIAGLLLLVAARGLGIFWAHPVVRVATPGGAPLAGVVMESEKFRAQGGARAVRSLFKVGNRDIYGFDFKWLDHAGLTGWEKPADIAVVERREYGDFIGFLQRVETNGRTIAEGPGAWAAFRENLPAARALYRRIARIKRHDIGLANDRIRAAEFRIAGARRRHAGDPARLQRAVAREETVIAREKERFAALSTEVARLQKESDATAAVFLTADGKEKRIPEAMVARAWRPNSMGPIAKVLLYLSKAFEFVTGEPREANTEGGVFPAIFGTVLMTLIMCVVVTPFGVLAAFYLREYAKQGFLVRAVRIAVNNLAGVPSIVFGMFGLGFFVYFVGGAIDQWFFADQLPNPTFGTGGILWASLTLAILTVPVVIVATEESIAAVPRGMREGSLALGASKFQTVCQIVLPASIPGILTGVILAMARGAGEVAPLMITGVVKLAPRLALDGQFPFLHADRKFMHLGFHIYDTGFQSPNIEAAKPMVFATTLLLLAVVVGLNIAAIRLRDRLRRRYQTGAFA